MSGQMAPRMRIPSIALMQKDLPFILPVSCGIRLLHIDPLQRSLGRITESHCSDIFYVLKDQRSSSSESLNSV